MVRFKNRYLLCVIEHDAYDSKTLENISVRSINSAVRTSVQTNFGDIIVGKLANALAVKFWSPALGLALIRSSRDELRQVWASISMINCLDCLPETVTIRIQVIHVGGTIRSCQKSAVDYARKLLLKSPDISRSKIDSDMRNFKAIRN